MMFHEILWWNIFMSIYEFKIWNDNYVISIILWYDYLWDEHLWHEHRWYEGNDVIYVICMSDDMKEMMLFMYIYRRYERDHITYVNVWIIWSRWCNYVYAWMIWRRWYCISMYCIRLYDDEICCMQISLY